MDRPRSAAGEPLEIERKFLIRYPDTALLDSLCREKLAITQVYLRRGPDGESRRVRRSVSHQGTRLYYSEKQRVTAVTRIEREREIPPEEFSALLSEADGERRPIEKTRWRLPLGERTLEIDVFPFWQGQAFCEVELEREDEPLALPPFVTVLREVTADERYTNSALARRVPAEDKMPENIDRTGAMR